MTVDGAHLLWNGCKVAIADQVYMQPWSCTACAGPCMQVSIRLRHKTIYGLQMFFAGLISLYMK